MIRTARALLLPALLASCAPGLATAPQAMQARSAAVQAPPAAPATPHPAAPVPIAPVPTAPVTTTSAPGISAPGISTPAGPPPVTLSPASPAPAAPPLRAPAGTPSVPAAQLPAAQLPATQLSAAQLPAAQLQAAQEATQPAAAPGQPPIPMLAQAAPQRPGSPEAQLLARLNVIRAAGVNCPGSGVRPPAGALSTSPTHAAAAYLQASYMARTGVISHGGPGGSTPRLRAASSGIRAVSVTEIIYLGGAGIDPEEAVQWWLHSPTHCFYMTDRRYSSAGASVVRGPHGAAYVMVLTSAPH